MKSSSNRLRDSGASFISPLWIVRRAVRGVAFFGLMLGLAAAHANAEETITIGVQRAMMPIYIAKATGAIAEIGKQHGVQIVFRSFAYGGPENKALAAGELQMASAGMGPAITASSRLPVKLLAITILEQTALMVPTDSPVKTVADLKGKTIVHPGAKSQQYPLLIKGLADAGLEVGDVTLFKVKGSEVGELVTAKAVDAGITWDPHVSFALASGKARILLKAESILPIKNGHYLGNGLYAREDFIAARPELVQDIISAVVSAVDLILDNPAKAIELWAQEIEFAEEVISYSMERGISVYVRNIAPDKASVETYANFLKDAGILNPTDFPKYDASFAEKAMAE
jgi:ABC-type nitrate/sulfonate/bicarbonate transport system substrate-binding protein